MRSCSLVAILLASVLSGCGQHSDVPQTSGPIGTSQATLRNQVFDGGYAPYQVAVDGPVALRRLPAVDDGAAGSVVLAGGPSPTSHNRVASGSSEPEAFTLAPPSAAIDDPAPVSAQRSDPHGLLTGNFDFEGSLSAMGEAEPEIMVTQAQLAQIKVPIEVSRRVSHLLQEGHQLAERKALFAAENTFRQALRTITQSMDAQLGKPYHTQALGRATRALREAEDFAKIAEDRGNALAHIAGFISGHDTPVLHNSEIYDVTPMVAVKRYHEYAYQQLMKAGGRDPLASESLFAVGQILNIQDTNDRDSLAQSPQCIPYLQAALTVNGSNVRAANELGVLLARRGRLAEAEHVLSYSARTTPSPLVLANLSDVQARLGDAPNAQVTRQQASELASTVPMQPQPQPNIVWVHPEAFKHVGAVPTPSEVAAIQRMSEQISAQPAQPQMTMNTPPAPRPANVPQNAARPNMTGLF